jgi:hypothetical protein
MQVAPTDHDLCVADPDEDAMGADEELKAILMELRMPQKR